jgi:DNA-binding NtrC family response regulator
MEETIHVLVVDDEPVMRGMLEKTLTKEGHSVYLASSAEEALEMLERNPVNIVLSDLSMPGMDGFALLKTLKESRPELPVIVMTAYADIYSVKDALLKGAEDYITKPFKSMEICMIVERAYWRSKSCGTPQNEPAEESR